MSVLRLAETAKQAGARPEELALEAYISATAMHRLMFSNLWPRRPPVHLIQTRLRDALARRGVSEGELETLFHGRASRVPSGVGQPAPTRIKLTEEVDVLLPKQTLTSQALKHFKLFLNPFDGPVERPEQFFASEDIAYVREVLFQAALGSRFIALVGESGSGKTTILSDLEERLLTDRKGIILLKPGVLGMEETARRGQDMRATDMLHAIISSLDSGAQVPATLQARQLRAQQLLTSSAEMGNSHLLVVEEAHGMPDTTLKHMKRMHELRHGRRSLLGVLLLAQPELKRRLADGLRAGSLREVAQRCEVVDLLPLDAELQGYLTVRARACGRALDTLMEADSVDALRIRLTRKVANGKASMVYPLAVNNALTRAMNLAAELGVPLVTAEVIKAI